MEQLHFPHPQSSPDLPTTHGGFLPVFTPPHTAPLPLDFSPGLYSQNMLPCKNRAQAPTNHNCFISLMCSLSIILQSGYSQPQLERSLLCSKDTAPRAESTLPSQILLHQKPCTAGKQHYLPEENPCEIHSCPEPSVGRDQNIQHSYREASAGLISGQKGQISCFPLLCRTVGRGGVLHPRFRSKPRIYPPGWGAFNLGTIEKQSPPNQN